MGKLPALYLGIALLLGAVAISMLGIGINLFAVVLVVVGGILIAWAGKDPAMVEEVVPVDVKRVDGTTAHGTFSICYKDPEHPELVHLTLALRDRQFAASASDFFTALCFVRREIEAEGLLLNCYGASQNVFPSGMSRDMGIGDMAYKLTMGQRARTTDLVSIFHTGPDVLPATVEDQEHYYHSWLESLHT